MALWHNIGPTSFFKTILNPSQLGTHKKGGVHTERPPWGVLRWHGYADFIIEKGKGLFSHENKPFYTPFGGDKRDRTADLLNAIQALSQLSYTPIFYCALLSALALYLIPHPLSTIFQKLPQEFFTPPEGVRETHNTVRHDSMECMVQPLTTFPL